MVWDGSRANLVLLLVLGGTVEIGSQRCDLVWVERWHRGQVVLGYIHPR